MADKTYVEQLNEKLGSAQKRVRQGREMNALKAAAPTLYEIIDLEISIEINKGYGDKPLPYHEYMASHGAAAGIRRIRNLMTGKEADEVPAAQEAEAIRDNLKQIKNDQK